MTALETMRYELRSVEEGIEYEKANDRSYLKWFTYLLRKRRVLKRSIRRLEKIEKKMARLADREAEKYILPVNAV